MHIQNTRWSNSYRTLRTKKKAALHDDTRTFWLRAQLGAAACDNRLTFACFEYAHEAIFKPNDMFLTEMTARRREICEFAAEISLFFTTVSNPCHYQTL